MPVLCRSQMSVNDTSRMIIDNSRVVVQIVASLTDDSRGDIYDRNMFIVQATGPWNKSYITFFLRY
jgi:hypothetical protein